MHRRWFVNRTNPEFVSYISRTSSVSPVLSQILINRGLKTAGEISSFLNPDLSQLSDPFDMQDMKKAVDRITAASKRGERVFVHGDYDVDGLSATAILFETLKRIGIDAWYFIPNRIEHGYGFNPPSVKKAKALGAHLIITVDCGITSFEATALCRKEGIDVIITDHHEPFISREQKQAKSLEDVQSSNSMLSAHRSLLLPDAHAVINPKISGQQSPVFHLSGAGIAFKLAQALAMHDSRLTTHDLFDLAALGTMADVVPLTGENRLIVKEGLKLMGKSTRRGLLALHEVSRITGKEMRTGLLLFTIIPRINAAGRMSDPNNVLKLLLTDSDDEANELSLWLDRLNTERQQIEEEVLQEALDQLHEKGVSPVIVLASERWYRGVIGIVASRIAEKFYRPTFILTIEGEIARGSARSIPSFDIYKALTQCKELLTGFGGHKQAAGLELQSRNIRPFEECMNSFARATLSDADLIPLLELDADIDFADINLALLKEVKMLEPFGCGNPEPVLGSKGLEVLYPKIVKDNHLKMKLRQKKYSLDAIGFDMAAFFEKLSDSETFDAAFTPMVNEWEGQRYLQLNLKALRPSQ
jgi:single-stranded-DNA-specific exonuclease